MELSKLLTDDDIKEMQPDDFSVELKDHQLTIIHAMKRLETTGKMTIRESGARITLTTNYGILSDMVGAGKTYEMVGLICSNPDVPNHETIKDSCMHCSISYTRDDDRLLNTTLIILPHILVDQWVSVLSHTKLRVYVINKRKHIIEDEDIGKYDVVVCSASMYTMYYGVYDMDRNNKYKRIVIDEVCTIRMPDHCRLYACFVWFISATPIGFMKKKNLFEYLCTDKRVMRHLIMKNDDEYVMRSMNIMPMNRYYIRCGSTREYDVLRDNVCSGVLDMLNAGDLRGAIFKLNCNVETTDDIMTVLHNKIKKDIHNKTAELNYTRSLIGTDRSVHINDLEKEIDGLNNRLVRIQEKIDEFSKTSCPLCYVDFSETTPGMLPCCDQILCMPCIVQSKQLNKHCALCRKVIDIGEVTAISDMKVRKTSTKMDVLVKLLRSKRDGRILLYSNYDATFSNMEDMLRRNNIKYMILRGTGREISKTIERFQSGKINVLLLNAQHYGSGLNLQMATDVIMYHTLSLEMETQVIGRAQRYGRESELNVYKLTYNGENVGNWTTELDEKDI